MNQPVIQIGHEELKISEVLTILGLETITFLACTIIGCLGLAGVLPRFTMGLCAIGLATEFILVSANSINLNLNKLTLVGPAVYSGIVVLMGVLGVAGAISAMQIGWVMALPGIILMTFFLFSSGTICCLRALQ